MPRQAQVHKSTVAKTAARYKATVTTGHGTRTCFEARRHRQGKKDLVARFGGIPLRQDRRAVIRDPAPAQASHPRKELIYRLRKRACELCEQGATVAVHQVAALKHLGTPGPGQPAWAALLTLQPARLLPPKRLSTPRSARRLTATNRGLLPGAPVPTRTGLSPVSLDQLSGRNVRPTLRACNWKPVT